MLTNEQIDFLKELVETPMPSGSEEAGALLLGRRIREWTGIQPTIDVHGNLHAVLDTGAKRTVLLEGHLDEIGYQVAYVDASGFVYFQAIGGIVAPLAAAERLVILTSRGPVNGVIGARPPHNLKPGDRNALPTDLRDMACDIGASSRAEALELVDIGDPAVAATGWRQLAGTRVSARGFDDRVGAFAMAEALLQLAAGRERLAVNVHFVASVSEEIGSVGGRTAVHAVNPEIGISCDVAHATDAPGTEPKAQGDIALGRGAALATGPIYHKGLLNLFRETGRTAGIPFQNRPVPRGSTNNGWAVKVERGGAATVQIGIPLRYMHSPVEVVDLADVAAVVDLTAASVTALAEDFPLLPQQP